MTDEKNAGLVELQRETCRMYGLSEAEPEGRVAVALETFGQPPVYGERVVLEEGETISWFFYGGKFSRDARLFKPIHTEHLSDILPVVLKFLRMPPGSGFAVDASGDEEIWVDENGTTVVMRIDKA
jgi:hypothetical protein